MKKPLSVLLLTFFLTGCSWFNGNQPTDLSEKTYPISGTDFDNAYAKMRQALKEQLLARILKDDLSEKMEMSSLLELSMDFEEDDGIVQARLNVEGKKQFDHSDKENPMRGGNVSVSGQLNYGDEKVQENNVIEGALEYRLFGRELYVYLDPFTFNISDQEISDEINQQINDTLTPWTDKWLKLSGDEILQSIQRDSSFIDFETLLRAWSPEQLAEITEAIFEAELFVVEEEKGEQDGFLVYDVRLENEAWMDLFVSMFKQHSVISHPLFLEEMENRIREEDNDFNIEGELSILKENAKYFRLDLDVKMASDEQGDELKIEWFEDKITFLVDPSGEEEEDVRLFEWLREDDNSGTIYFGTANQERKIAEGNYDETSLSFKILTEPWRDDSPKIMGEFDKKDDVYSGTITIQEGEDRLILDVDTFKLSDQETKLTGKAMIDGDEALSIRFERERKTIKQFDYPRVNGEVESLTQTVAGFLGLMMLGLDYQLETQQSLFDDASGNDFLDRIDENQQNGGNDFFANPSTEN